MTDKDRFMAKVDVDPDGCWQWTASLKPAGYGQLTINRKVRLAHRVAYEMFVGPIPEGLQLDHLCRNRGCVNPSHLEPVTNRENGLRGAAVITHCPSGHPYEGDNLFVSKRGWRTCRTCNRLNVARIKQLKREAS